MTMLFYCSVIARLDRAICLILEEFFKFAETRKGYGGRGADGAVGGGWRRRPEPGAARYGELCEPYAPSFLLLFCFAFDSWEFYGY